MEPQKEKSPEEIYDLTGKFYAIPITVKVVYDNRVSYRLLREHHIRWMPGLKDGFRRITFEEFVYLFQR